MICRLKQCLNLKLVGSFKVLASIPRNTVIYHKFTILVTADCWENLVCHIINAKFMCVAAKSEVPSISCCITSAFHPIFPLLQLSTSE